MTQSADRYTEDVPRTREAAVQTLHGFLQPVPPGQPVDEAIAALGTMIDLSGELRHRDATDEAIRRGERLLEGALCEDQRATVHYFLANAWEEARRQRRSERGLADWEQPEVSAQVIHLRHAARLMEASAEIGTAGESAILRRCQIYTNLGNVMSLVGRLVDAITYWGRALDLEPQFAMAIANRGYGWIQYAQLVHDPGHRVHLLRAADGDLSDALLPRLASQMHREPRAFFTHLQGQLRAQVPAEVLAPPTAHEHSFAKRISKRERAYREWCLARRLFLNDLNDLYTRDPLAARDVLVLPDVATPVDAGMPHTIGFFNQLKQEFTSARISLFEGVNADRIHFADRDVTLIDTLDYPAYGHAAEQIKVAYRLAYSLFDKIAYFLNDYLALSIPEKKVSFRSVWYVHPDRSRGLLPEISRPENTPLKALFWLAKDFYEDELGFTDALEPDARDLADLRNHLEHKYVKLQLFYVPTEERYFARGPLAYSLSRSEFERRALRLLQLARSALLYLSMGVYVEEARRRAAYPSQRSLSLPLIEFEDRFKL